MPRALTPGLQAQVLESGRIVSRIEVHDYLKGELLLSTDPLNAGDLRMKVVDGSITTDESRSVVGTGTARLLVDEETAAAVIPLVGGTGLSPSAPARIAVSFQAPEEAVSTSYGVYEIESLDADETSQGIVMSAEVSDNSRRVERARFWRPVTIANKTPYATAFATLLDPVLSSSVIDVAPTVARTGVLQFDVQDDRLSAVNEMATAIGFRIDWNDDGVGNVAIYPDSDIDDGPVWTFVDGGNAKVTTVKRSLTDERTYNGVIAMGEASGSDKPPVRAEWWDLNPNSPTFFDPLNPEASAYGPVPFFYVSQFLTTTRQAQTAAKARLPKVLGLVEVLSIEAIPNPGIVPGDAILVRRPRVGVEGVFVVESVVMPLTGSGGRMTITCRDRRLVE